MNIIRGKTKGNSAFSISIHRQRIAYKKKEKIREKVCHRPTQTQREQNRQKYLYIENKRKGEERKKIERTQTRGARMGVLDEGNIKKWNI